MKTARLFVGLLSLIWVCSANAQTIYSTSSGGNWSDTLTWVGYEIPYYTDDVVIDGPVIVNQGGWCNNLTINSGASLKNHVINSQELLVYGSITNYGSISDYAGYVLTIKLSGNITNSGSIDNYQINFRSANDKTLINSGTFSPTNMYTEGTSGNIIAGSNLIISNCSIYFPSQNLDLNGYMVEFSSGHYHGQIAGSSGILKMSAGAYLYASSLYGTIELQGNIQVHGTCNSYGNLLVTDTLQNYSTSSYEFNSYGSLTNNGLIRNYAGYILSIYCHADFTNFGVVQNNRIEFTGVSAHSISSSTPLNMSYLSSTSSTGIVSAASNLEFVNCNISMNSGTFDLDGYTLSLSGGYLNVNALYAGSGILKMTNNSRMWQTHIYEDIEFQNCIQVDGGNSVHGNLTLTDTLQNYSTTSFDLTIYGNIVNNGLIRNNAGYALFLYCKGNITNYSVWENHTTNITGTGIQEISCTSPFSSQNFSQLNTTGYLSAVSSISFKQCNIYLNNNAFHLNSYPLSINGNTLQGGNLNTGNSSIELLGDAYLYQLKIYDDVEFKGKIQAHGGGVNVYNTITVTDTLCNRHGSSSSLNAYGDIINNGVIEDFGGYSFTLNCYGNVSNNGDWTNNSTNLSGDSIEYITQTTPIGPTNIYVSDTTGYIIAGSNLDFVNCNINFNHEEIYLNGYQLSMAQGELLYANLMSGSGILSMTNDAYLNSSHIYGDIELKGKVLIYGDANYFYNTITVTDTLCNRSNYNYTCHAWGDVINNGVISNNYWSLNMACKANITNNGAWTVSYTYLSGNGIQWLTFTQPITTGNFMSTDTAGYIMAGSNLEFTNCTVNLQGEELYLSGYDLKINNNSLQNANIYASNGSLTMTNSAYMQSCQVLDNIELKRKVQVNGDANHFYGDVIVTDTLCNQPGYTYTCNVHGNIINNGLITNNNYSLYVNCWANITNNGIWNCNRISMIGGSMQYITCTEPISTYYFFSSDTAGHLATTTNLEFVDCRIDLAGEELYMNGYELKINGNYIQNSIIYSGNGSLKMTGNSYLTACNIYDNIELLGQVQVYQNNTYFHGNVSVTDTLQNHASYSYTAYVKGNLINNGLIRNNYYNLSIESEGNLYNNGTWTNYYTVLGGSDNQSVFLYNNATLGGLLWMRAQVTGASSFEWFRDNQSLIGESANQFSNESGEVLQSTGPAGTDYYGTYYCATDSGNSRNIFIQSATPPFIVNVGADISLCSGNETTLDAVISGGMSPYSYLWSNNETTQSISVSPLTNTDYHIIVTDNNGALAFDTVSITVFSALTVDLGPDQEICEGGNAIFEVYNGTSFLWSDGSTASYISPSTSGTYSVTVTDANGCTGTDEADVIVNLLPIVDLGVDISACEGDFVIIEPYLSGTFLWSTGSTMNHIPVTSSGTYSLTFTDTNDCSNSDEINVTINSLPIVNLGPDQILPNGSTPTLDAGAGATAYLWSTGATSQTITVSISGLYSVTITDANGCENADEVHITIEPPVNTLTVTLVPDFSLCEGSGTMIFANSTGGTLPYTFLWSTGQTLPHIPVTPVVTTTYSITVTDAQSNVAIDSVVITVNPLPVVDLGVDIIACEGDFVIIEPNLSGTFLWSNGSTMNHIPVTTSGTYSLTLTDGNGCSNSDEINVTFNPLPVVNLGPDLNLPTGSTPILDAGAGFTSYIWSTGETTQTISVNTSGTYSVTEIDANGCSNSDQIVVTISGVSTSGAFWVATTGSDITGTGTESNPYATIQHAVDQCVDLDTVIVKDGTYSGTGNCEVSIDSLDIVVRSENGPDNCIINGIGTFPYSYAFAISGESTNLNKIMGFTIQNFSDYGIKINKASPHIHNCILKSNDTGIASFGGYQGAPITPVISYCLILDNPFSGIGLFDNGHPTVFNNTIVGNGHGINCYYVVATVYNNIIVANINGIFNDIFGPAVVNNTFNNAWNNTTNYENLTAGTGSISIDPLFIGSGDYHLQSTSPCINAGDSSTYDPDGSIADMGCYPYLGTVIPSISVNLGADQSVCEGVSITLTSTVLGGTPPYSYLWSTGDTTQSILFSPTITTTYTVTVSDSGALTATDDVEVIVNPLPVVDLGADIVACEGDFIIIEPNLTGTFLWSTGSTMNHISVTTSGTYSLTLTDGNGCIDSDGIVVNFNPLPVVDLEADFEICEGGTGFFGVYNVGTYLWSDGSTDSYILPTVAGPYSLTVTDNNGCSGSDTAELIINPLPIVDLGADFSSCEGEVEDIHANTTGSYNWSTGSTNSYILATTSGTYSLTIIDSNGCYGSDDVDVTFNPLPLVNLGPDQTILLGNDFTFDAGAGFVSYLWSNGATTQTITVGTQGQYEVVVTDNNGCSNSDEVYLTVTTSGTGPGWLPINTSVMHTILIPDTAEITIDGTPIAVGDYIGVFYDSSGTPACGGYAVWDGQTTNITAWGDDFVTTEKDGFYSGESFTFVIWQASTATTFMAIADYMPQPLMPNQGDYFVNGLSGIVSLNSTSTDYQYINLPQGWSYFSTYIDLFEPGIDSLFSNIVSNVYIAKDGDGFTFWPQWGLNTIGDLVIGKGYQVKMVSAQTLVAEGVAVQPQLTPVTIPTGWSMLGYLRQTPASIATMLSPVVSNVVIVKDSNGLTYWPQWGLNTIGDMDPGEGFPIKMTAAVQLIYPANSVQSKSNPVTNLSTKHFKDARNTGSNMTLGIPLEAWGKIPEFGDEVGIFNMQDQLVGASVFEGRFMAVTLWGSDQHDPSVFGIEEGEAYTAKIWNSIEKEERNIEFEAFSEGSSSYENNGIAILSKMSITGRSLGGISAIKVYPNPTNSFAQISLSAYENTIAEMVLYNSNGEQVLQQKNIAILKSQQYFKIDLSEFPAGLYILKIQTSKEILSRSIELIK
ncbi:MAG: T9SS type A sorting domain-containing protein [Bacteroidales bacterium]|nr:T9SS type A sorting domain-containing protein [Bacteroidales bacterium]MCF8456304.1 T9SS type A sorting domain-containing protein [Bacteroidales bacterium]